VIALQKVSWQHYFYREGAKGTKVFKNQEEEMNRFPNRFEFPS
jgi:hypothetical protein